jgi:hypothetical protein
MSKRKESMSRTGYGNFASKQERFSSSYKNIKITNPSVELIYARNNSTPGPGHYDSAD